MEDERTTGEPAATERPTKRKRRRPFRVAGVEVPPGEHRVVDLQVTRHFAHSDVVVPLHVVHGKREGPVLLVCAAVHGDEINGVEVVRRLLKMRQVHKLRGTLLAVPVVNVHGFMAHSRYVSDGRDLNRCFPGLTKGSLASRLARHFDRQVVARATHAIDLHTGTLHRAELPHLRTELAHADSLGLARAFGAPVVVGVRRWPGGSLAAAARERELPVLVYEGGEALRFDEVAIRTAVRGVLGVLRGLDMLKPSRPAPAADLEPFVARATRWVRAPDSGVLITSVPLGALVVRGQVLATITDPVGESEVEVVAPADGVVISKVQIPLVNEGDALFNLALGDAPPDLVASLERYEGAFDDELDASVEEEPEAGFPAEPPPRDEPS